MRNHDQFVTPFWRKAYESLPAAIRGRYLTQIQAAERWELAIADLLEVWTRAKNASLRLIHAH